MKIPYRSVNGLHFKIMYFDLGGKPNGIDYVKFLEYIDRFKPFELEEPKFPTNFIPKPIKLTSNIRRNFQSKAELMNELTDKIGASIPRHALKNYINSKAKLSKGDVESFLEGLLWNENGEITPELVAV